MRRKYPPYTHGFIDRNGTPRFYLRMPGRKRVPLPGLPWSPQFMAAREAAMTGEEQQTPPIGSTATVAGTVNAAIIDYYQSTAWTEEIGEASRNERRPILEKFREEHGDKRLALIHATALRNILEHKSPASQRHFRRALRGLIKCSIGKGWLQTDPFAVITLAKQKQKGEYRGIIPWRPEQCEQFEKFYPLGTRARLAYELLLQAGQSKCDVIRMGRQHIRNGLLSGRRQKTGVPFHAVVTAELQAAIDAMPTSDHLTFLTTEQGKPFTAAGFGNWFREGLQQGRTAAAGRGDRQAVLHVAWFAQGGGVALGRARGDNDAAESRIRLEDVERSRYLHRGGRARASRSGRGGAQRANTDWQTQKEVCQKRA